MERNVEREGMRATPERVVSAVARLIGVGTAGGRLLADWAGRNGSDLSGLWVLPPWDTLPMTVSPGLTCVQVRGSWKAGWSVTGDPDRARAVAEEEFGRLVDLCRGTEWVVMVAGLGGGAGSGMTPVLARAAHEAGARAMGVVVTPFHWEGAVRQRQAQVALDELRGVCDGLVCLPNQKFLPLLPPRTPLVEVYQQVNRALVLGLESFWDALTQRGLIPLPWEHLCALLRGRHAESVWVTAEAEGEDRLARVTARFREHPLLENGQALLASTSVLVHITAGPDLAAAEADELVRVVQELAPRAELVVGATLRDAWSGRIRVMLLVTRRGQGRMTGWTGMGEAALRGKRSEPGPSETGGDGMAGQAEGRESDERDVVATGGDALKEARNTRRGGRVRYQQGVLPLEVARSGRFEKTPPNIHRGEDLDVPTYLRRGVMLE
ncbi:MAG: cell division protein FtsZ [Limisphaera sp.]|nr:MAG: cell division protein FtsZ [Limisphaera sp.]